MQAIDRHYDRIEQEFHRTNTEKEQHMNRKLVIFDMDGTILDTLEDLKDALNHVLTQHSFPVRTLDEVRRFVGNGIYKLIERGVPAGTPRQEIDAVYEDFKPYYAAHCEDTTKAYDGIPALLRQLKAQGFAVAVVSNKADFAVQKLCEVYFPDTFDAALCIAARGKFCAQEYPLYVKGIRDLRGHIYAENYSPEVAATKAPLVMYMAACLLTGNDYIRVEDPAAFMGEKLTVDKLMPLSYLRKANPVAYAYAIKTDQIMADQFQWPTIKNV